MTSLPEVMRSVVLSAGLRKSYYPLNQIINKNTGLFEVRPTSSVFLQRIQTCVAVWLLAAVWSRAALITSSTQSRSSVNPRIGSSIFSGRGTTQRSSLDFFHQSRAQPLPSKCNVPPPERKLNWSQTSYVKTWWNKHASRDCFMLSGFFWPPKNECFRFRFCCLWGDFCIFTLHRRSSPHTEALTDPWSCGP